MSGRQRMGWREYAWTLFWVALALTVYTIVTGQPPWPEGPYRWEQ